MDAMITEYLPMSTVLTTDCRLHDLHLCITKAVKLCGLSLVENYMMADKQKKIRIELN